MTNQVAKIKNPDATASTQRPVIWSREFLPDSRLSLPCNRESCRTFLSAANKRKLVDLQQTKQKKATTFWLLISIARSLSGTVTAVSGGTSLNPILTL